MIGFEAKILRKQDDLPRYIIVKPEHVGGRSAAFQAQVRLNDGPFVQRNIRPWGKGDRRVVLQPDPGPLPPVEGRHRRQRARDD